MRGVRVRYQGSEKDAVAGVDLDVAAGELLVLLGASGSGKSTLMRTINGLVPVTAGSIEVDGRDITTIEPETLRRGIGYVIQAVGLFPHMTVEANIAIVPELLGWERTRVSARVEELLRLVRLDPQRYRERLPRELSGGEQQRVGVARALAAEPQILLMDEPFGAVDAIVRLALQDELVHIHQALGTTIVFVTHDVDEALRIAQRIAIVHAGRLVQVDVPLRILAHPADRYVADLTGAADVVRRLGLITAREAALGDGAGEGQPTIDAGASLREALGRLLLDGAPLVVVDGGRPCGVLDLGAIGRALRA
ncbi:MAG: ABC transporter ATP-binding protein [Candidatus Eremiobacteraeota bacterium]|nr:ABC transporter ATP-binding protein [Candidatus Eremiobacteraeota bacterium]